MAARSIYQSGRMEYQLPALWQATDGDALTYSADAGGLVWQGQTPDTIITVNQNFTATISGNATVSVPFQLTFKKDLQTNLVTVAFNPLLVQTPAGATYTHTSPCLNTGTGGEFVWELTPVAPLDPNFAQMLPAAADIQFDGNTNVYNCQFSTFPTPSWNYAYMPMSAVFTIGHLGNINIICKANAIQQNEFCTLTRPDGLAGSTAICGQYLFIDGSD